MKGAYIFFADGFEETEAIAPIDVLRRGGVDLKIVSIYDRKMVMGSHGIPMGTDMDFEEFLQTADFSDSAATDVMLFPGGMPGSVNLAEKEELMEIMLNHYAEGGTVAAICAAPSLVLSQLPDLDGKKMTCYDGFEPNLIELGVKYSKEGVVEDGNIITSRGAGHAVAFGLKILAHIKDQATAERVAGAIML